MSKLSIHISGNATGLNDLLLKTYNANSPVKILYSLNNNIKDAIVRFSPTTKWVYRRQTETFNRLPNGFFTGDPVQSAVNWLVGTKDRTDKWRTQMENWSLNQADYFDPLNEPVIELPLNPSPEQIADAIRKARWLNTWMVTALELSYQKGFKLALFSFASESGTLNPLVWKELAPSFILGKNYGAILSLHAYGIDSGLKYKPSAYKRHVDIYNLTLNGEYVIPESCRLPVIYSEVGAGNGYDTCLSGRAYLDDLAECDNYWMTDNYVLGACSFQLGTNVESNMASIMGIYGDYIATHPDNPLPVVNQTLIEILGDKALNLVVSEQTNNNDTVYVTVPRGYTVNKI